MPSACILAYFTRDNALPLTQRSRSRTFSTYLRLFPRRMIHACMDRLSDLLIPYARSRTWFVGKVPRACTPGGSSVKPEAEESGWQLLATATGTIIVPALEQLKTTK